MSSSCRIVSTLEQLPDELFLLVCRYLSSADILFSLYDLNSRLSQTISGYCQHVVLAQIPFRQFKYICTSILPEIGTYIQSLAVSNQWKGILSRIFLSYFGDKMSLTFPHLRSLTFIAFSGNSLESFLGTLKNLSELHKISICQLSESAKNPIASEILLHKIFTVNNYQLNSVFFDDQSIVFTVDNENHDSLYSNIKKLTIDLMTINDLHRLLTILPQLTSINVTINKDSFKSDKLNANIPIVTLKQFQLQSFGPSWNFDDLESITKRLPNVEELSIAIESRDDISLMDGEKFFSLLSTLSIRKFNYFVRFYDSECSIDHTKIFPTWEQFEQEFVCIKSDDNKTLALYTLPFIFSYLILPNSLAKNEVFIRSYALQVKDLTLCHVSKDIVDVFPVIKKCQRIHILDLRIDDYTAPRKISFFVFNNQFLLFVEISEEIQLCKLYYLTRVSALRESTVNTKYFQKLLEVSPNLHHFEVSYEFLRPLLDNNEPICLLLQQRITHIYILIPKSASVESVISSIPQLASVFSSLKHFYFGLEKGYQSSESLVVAVLNSLFKWNSLVSFGVVDAVMTLETSSKDIEQWVMENSTLHEHSSFVVDYTNEIFRLWL
jgi:hypothetical protein